MSMSKNIVVTLTRWIGDDCIEEATTSPWIPSHVECAKIYNPLVYTILTRGTHDARLLFYDGIQCLSYAKLISL